MSSVFIKILNLSLSASWLILAVILLRALLKKAPKWFPCALWALVAIRLIVPFSFESTASLIPSSETIPAGFVTMENPKVESGISYINKMINPALERAVAPSENSSAMTAVADVSSAKAVDVGSSRAASAGADASTVNSGAMDAASAEAIARAAAEAATDPASSGASDASSVTSGASTASMPSNAVAPKKSNIVTMQNIFMVANIIWLCGAVIILGYASFSALRLKNRIAASIEVEEGVFVCDEVKSPFIFGIFRPKIYVPSSMQGKTLSYVLAHERSHLARRDNWWKPLGFLLLAVYWFNPLSWVAYILLCRDIEMACDEKVIRDMEKKRAAEYSQALLDCSLKKSAFAACPLAFGEVGVKQRVKNVLNYRKPRYLFVGVLVVLCGVVTGCFLTNPKKGKETTLTEPEQKKDDSSVEETEESEQMAATLNYPVEAKGDTNFTVSSLYTVDIKATYFDGATVIVDYDLIPEEGSDPQKLMEDIYFFGMGYGKVNGHDIETDCCIETKCVGTSGNTVSCRAQGFLQCPTERVYVEFHDGSLSRTYQFELNKSSDAKIQVLTSGKADNGDFQGLVGYDTNMTFLPETEDLVIDRIIIAESAAYIFYEFNENLEPRITLPIDRLEMTGKDDLYRSIYDTFQGCYPAYDTSVRYLDTENDGLMVLSFHFDIPSDWIWQMFHDAKYRLADEQLSERKRPRENVVDFTEPVTFNYPGFSIRVKSAEYDGDNLECVYDVSFTEVPTQDPLNYYYIDCIGSDSLVLDSGNLERESTFPTRTDLVEKVDEKTFTYRIHGTMDWVFDYVDLTIQDKNSDDEFTLCVKNVNRGSHVFRPESFDGPKNDGYIYHTIDFESDDERFILYEIVLKEEMCYVYYSYKDESNFDVMSGLDIAQALGIELEFDDAAFGWYETGYIPFGEVFLFYDTEHQQPLPDSVLTKSSVMYCFVQQNAKLFSDSGDKTNLEALAERLDNAKIRLKTAGGKFSETDALAFKANNTWTIDYDPQGTTILDLELYKMRITDLSFNGSMVNMTYELISNEEPIVNVTQGFWILGMSKGSMTGRNLSEVVYLHPDFAERSDTNTLAYTACGILPNPAETLQISVRDYDSGVEYIINVKIDDAYKVYIFRDESDTRPKMENVEYLPLPEWECADENFVLDQIIVTKTECMVYYGYKTMPDAVNVYSYDVFRALQAPMAADDPDLLNPGASEWEDGKKPVAAYFGFYGGTCGPDRMTEGEYAAIGRACIEIHDEIKAYDGLITQEYVVEKLKNMHLELRTEEEYRLPVNDAD